VAALLAAGATLDGKTVDGRNWHSASKGVNAHYGTPVNPALPGSNSRWAPRAGSGVAVAAGLVDVALGTDTGGSVRVPRQFFSGIFRLPADAWCRVGRRASFRFSPSYDTVGLVSRANMATLSLGRPMRCCRKPG